MKTIRFDSSPRPSLKRSALLAAAFSTGITAHAASVTWDGGGANDNWTAGLNWAGNVAPVANDILVFDQNARLAATNDFTAATQFDGLAFGTSAGAFALAGNSLTLGGNLTDNSLNVQTVGNALVLGVAPTIGVTQKNGALVLGGAISGPFGLTKTGPGNAVLSVTNTFAGTIGVTGGTLSFGGGGDRLGNVNNPIVLDGGTLRTTTSATIVSTHGITVGNAGGGSGTLDLQNNVTYAGVIAGASASSGLTKTGGSTLTLTSTNTYTGTTTLNQGFLTLDLNAAAGGVTTIVNASSPLVMAGFGLSLNTVSQGTTSPTVYFQGRTNTASTQTFNGVTLNQGLSTLVARTIGTQAATLNLGAITRNPGALLNTSRIKANAADLDPVITTSSANTNGILGAWATSSAVAVSGTGQAGTDWAAVSGGNIVPYTDYTVLGTAAGYGTTTAPLVASDATKNLKLDATSTVALTAGATTNASPTVTVASTAGLVAGLLVTGTGIPANATVLSITDATTFVLSANATATNTGLTLTAIPTVAMAAAGVTDANSMQTTDASARTLTIGAGNTLRLGASGGIWKTQGNGNAFTLTGGTLTAGGATDTAGEIVLNANATNTSTGGILVNSIIADNGTGVVSLTKTGQGSVDVNQPNTFTGGTYIGNGRLAGNNATSYGTGAVRIQPGGQAFLSGAVTYANNFVIAGNGTSENGNFGTLRLGNAVTTVGTATSTITLAADARIGRSNDTNVATLASQITGDHNLEFAANGGGAEVNRNVFLLTDTGNDWGGNLGINAQALGAGQTTAFISSNTVAVRLGAAGVIPNGAGKGNVVIGGGTNVANFGTLDLNGFDETINGLVAVSNPAQTRVTNNAAGTGTATLTLGDGDATATFGGVIRNGATAFTALAKTGGGTQTLSGANTYTGATAVNAGTLAVTGSLAAGSAVTVAASATLAGIGPVAGTVTSSGTVAPGTSVGTLTTGAATLSAGTLAIEVSGATADKLFSTGAINLAGAALAVTELAAGTAYPYVIAEGTSLAGTFASVPSGFSVTYNATQAILNQTGGSGYDSWKTLPANGLTAGVNDGVNDDPDLDGIVNLAEFVFGGIPAGAGASDTSILPDISLTPTDLVVSFDRANLSEGDVTLKVQWSTDLATWGAPDEVTVGVTGSGIVAVTPGSPLDDVSVSIPRTEEVAGKLFARVLITRP